MVREKRLAPVVRRLVGGALGHNLTQDHDEGVPMPAVLTHDLFGRGVLGDVADLIGLDTVDERNAFLLGNQGPDPLFYLVVDPLMNKWRPLGPVMHDSRPATLMLAMREAVERLDGRDRQLARAYVAGFACHWRLDSLMHPFVYHWQNGLCSAGVEGLGPEDANKVHAEVERDLDEMVLYATCGRTVERYQPHEHVLAASPRVLSAIDKVYFYVALWVYGRPIDPRTFSTAVCEFRLVQRAFDSASGRKRALFGGIERLVTHSPYSIVCAMSHRARAHETSDFDNREHRAWENPFTHEVSHDGFWDIYQRAHLAVLPLVDELLTCEPSLEAMRALTGDVNFEGDVSAPDAAFEW